MALLSLIKIKKINQGRSRRGFDCFIEKGIQIFQRTSNIIDGDKSRFFQETRI